MNKLLTALLALSALALSGCTTEDDGDPEVVDMDGLEITVETAIDDIDSEDDGDVLMDLELDGDAADSTRQERLDTVRALLRQMADEEPCALRGVLGGRYEDVEDVEYDGVFGGRAYRGYETLVAVGEGSYSSDEDGDGGTIEGLYSAFEGGEGDLVGAWEPATVVEGVTVGSFEGTWSPADGAHEGGNIAGLWHPTGEGDGLFLGFWSRCDAERAH
jgi:hypothetical protein